LRIATNVEPINKATPRVIPTTSPDELAVFEVEFELAGTIEKVGGAIELGLGKGEEEGEATFEQSLPANPSKHKHKPVLQSHDPLPLHCVEMEFEGHETPADRKAGPLPKPTMILLPPAPSSISKGREGGGSLIELIESRIGTESCKSPFLSRTKRRGVPFKLSTAVT
jgi:hypothetical protein